MINDTLLIELITEELPPLSQKELGEHFGKNIYESLIHNQLTSASEYETFSTPRRLGVKIFNVASEGLAEKKLIKLMPKKIGLDSEGNAQQALNKKLESIGEASSFSKIIVRDDDLYIEKNIVGKKLYEILENLINDSIKNLPIKKVMSYQLDDGCETVSFVRPFKNLVVIHGREIVSMSILGIKSSRFSIGHRFESERKLIELSHANEYEDKLLNEGRVIANFQKRKNAIENQIIKASEGMNINHSDFKDEALLEEVTALVEMPNILVGEFESKYLNVPHECLILTMKSNQKYFPILGRDGQLTNQFFIVSNLTPDNPKMIIEGNEKVIRPRLADAEFFFKQDKKNTLIEMSHKLDKIIYHNKLGTQAERAKRVSKIHRYIHEELSLNNFKEYDRLSLLAKADLVSLMVGEFPELQGIMGRYYALHINENTDIADAIEDHYKPKFSGDTLPRGQLGSTLALADKFETLISLFSIDEKPTGDKDPFGLRRNAIGVVRLLIENNLELNVTRLIENFMPKNNTNKTIELKTFIDDRLINFLKERNYLPQEIDSIMANSPCTFYNLIEKIDAIRIFSKLDGAEQLSAANKRVSNILKKYDQTNFEEIQTSLLLESQEKDLFDSLNKVIPIIDGHLKHNNYIDALKNLAALKDPIDNFFDKVMVNAENVEVKNNRHNLLIKLHQTLNCVADISRISMS